MFALFEVSQLCLVPLSRVWTLLIYPQTGAQVNQLNSAKLEQLFFFFFLTFEDFSQ